MTTHNAGEGGLGAMPARPFTERNDDGSHLHSHPGMSTRDHAALELLAGMGTWTPGNEPLVVYGRVSVEALAARAAFAVAQADALLVELGRPRAGDEAGPFAQLTDTEVLHKLVDEALDRGALDNDTPFWRELARRTGRNPESGNLLSEEGSP